MRLIRLLKRDLARETSTWVDEGMITREQAESICAHYGLDYQEISSRSYGYNILMALGYLFIGLALITLVGANWEDIPRGLRMYGLILITLVFNGLALRQYTRDSINSATGFFFLGGLSYGASIMLIAQIYHIGEHFPDGIFWWAMGILPLALILKSTLIMLLTTALAFVWFFVESSLDFYPWLFIVFIVALAWHVLRVKQSNFLFLALVIGLGTLIEYTIAWYLHGGNRFEFGAENVALGVALFLFLHGLSQWLSSRPEHSLKDYGLLLEAWILRFAILSLFVFSFEEPWKELIGAEWERPVFIIALTCLLVATALGLALASKMFRISTAAFSAWYLVALVTVMLVDTSDSILLQVADNIMLVITGVWLIVCGIREGISHYFYAGIIAIMGTALLRYIDLVGDYVGAALLFAFFAVILIATARFWKKELTDKMVP